MRGMLASAGACSRTPLAPTSVPTKPPGCTPIRATPPVPPTSTAPTVSPTCSPVPPDFFFNPTILACDWASNVACNNVAPTAISPSPPPRVSPSPVVKPSPPPVVKPSPPPIVMPSPPPVVKPSPPPVAKPSPPPVVKPSPPPVAKPSPPPPPPTGGGSCPYTIKSGDTLWAIAQVYGTDVATLQALNPGIVSTNLQVGQIINVPCGGGGSSPPPPPAKTGLSPPPIQPAPAGLLFSPYKDVTINMDWNTNTISSSITGTRLPVTNANVMPSGLRALTWAFATGDCGSEMWAGVSPSPLVSANVQAFVNAGKQYIISTGGVAGVFRCGSDAGFTSFIQRYSSSALIGIDFDIEGGQTQADIISLVARVKAARDGAYGKLQYSFTLATLGGATGNQLNTLGTLVMTALKDAQVGWTNIFINHMVMDYGSSCTAFNAAGVCDMGQSAINAAQALNSYWGVPYSSIELTPMIGGNDSPGQTFTLADVKTVSAFVRTNGLGGVHTWSLDRDVDCPPGAASATCNSYGVAGTLGFTNSFLSELGAAPVGTP
ncbi:hypothetical protein PLESTB_001630400 [Pleodorina starrii]|uniref:LysM domain-containing protein n=1 Tax=Pleodorina starrii TaxID=330485 RepID=A0A9W6F8U4_9CHLO|nr:hypothetical protein PLESTM_000975900 [Pleodorina starrii]GLC60583.1 hypothetical protein PLESTB_001630400 [Pleodorina starrii]GLC76686.1 hypothetical protein PLESTF_001817000 [Pleodorina starrii]